MDVNREVGSAVFLANEDKGVKVDLTNPDVTIGVEVRGRSAFVFTDRIPGPGGLPYGSGGRLLCYLGSGRDALAAWMLMRRGCRTYLYHDDDALGARCAEALGRYVPGIRSRPLASVAGGGNGGGDEGGESGGGNMPTPDALRMAMDHRRALGFVSGASVEDVEKGDVVVPDGEDVLVLYPLVGMGEGEVGEWMERTELG
jgi:adenylyl- and sulfurtransferase ThiI